MITELMTFSRFPHWLTRKDNGQETILTMDHSKPISIGDGFCFYTKPNPNTTEPDMQSLNYFKVVEVLEQRLSKGKYSAVETPQHFKLRCELVSGVIDYNAIQFSKGYDKNESKCNN